MENLKEIKKEQESRDIYITDKEGVNQPAWEHEDGTFVSYWDNLSELLIKDEHGISYISHSEAREYGYEE